MTSHATPDTAPAVTVLVVDDDTAVVELLETTLKFQGFTVYTAADGIAAIDCARSVRPDAVILEVSLPGMDGFSVLRQLRAHRILAPALFLSARVALNDKLTGLVVGGDDYITKPFNLEELVARLRVVLRRTHHGFREPRSHRLSFADLELELDTHEAWKAGRPVALTPTEFGLLRFFLIHAGNVLSKPMILEHVWPHHPGVDVNIVESYVSCLRRKVDTDQPHLLHTLRGLGYVLREPPLASNHTPIRPKGGGRFARVEATERNSDD